MIFTLEVLPAKEGDCLLLHWGSKTAPKLAVIDGGPARVYEDTLKPRLEEIAKRSQGPLKIDLVMVSHVDNDHIVGIKKLFRDLRSDAEKETPDDERLFRVDRLWHNTFNDILGDGLDTYFKKLPKKLTASVDGAPGPEVLAGLKASLQKKGEEEHEAEHVAYDIGLLLAGHGEARELRDSQKLLFDKQEMAALNHPFTKDGRPTLITAELTPKPQTLSGLSFKIVGPLQAQIERLQQEFDTFLVKKGLTAEAMLAAYADTSVPNLSSIVALVKTPDYKLLLTGDARGDYIIDGLKQAKIKLPLEVDILKVPHHGSARNLEPDFFEKIVADTYVFSASGKDGNPDRESLEWLIDARGKSGQYTIVLTYKIPDIDKLRKADSKDWKPARDSLAALFKSRLADGYKFTVVESGSKIELGDKIPW